MYAIINPKELMIKGKASFQLAMKTKTEAMNNSSNQKKGYNELKLTTPSEAKLNCTTQNISVSGYSLDVSGSGTTSGNVRISVLGTDYTNTTTFSGETWSIDFHPCLISGQVYTLQILISDDTGRRGEILQKYPAK